MAKFNAGQAVERLEYDFEDYGGGKGFITEPTTGTVNQFFKNMKNLAKEVNALRQLSQEIDVENMDEEALAKQMNQIGEAEEGATKFQNATIEYLAELCGAERVTDEDGSEHVVGGSPSMQELERLPYRVLQAFTTWLMEQIKPKKTTPGSSR